MAANVQIMNTTDSEELKKDMSNQWLCSLSCQGYIRIWIVYKLGHHVKPGCKSVTKTSIYTDMVIFSPNISFIMIVGVL